MAACVSVCYLCADARDNFRVAVNKLHQAGRVERGKVVRIVSAGQLGNVAVGILPFGSLNEMPCARKRWLKLAVVVAVGCAARVVEMQDASGSPNRNRPD